MRKNKRFKKRKNMIKMYRIFLTESFTDFRAEFEKVSINRPEGKTEKEKKKVRHEKQVQNHVHRMLSKTLTIPLLNSVITNGYNVTKQSRNEERFLFF